MMAKSQGAEKSEQTKRKILASTRDIYLESGLAAVSMRKVAKEAGLSTMATYRHFENKNDLLSHVVLEGFRIFQSYFSKALLESTPEARLLKCADLYLQFALENKKYYEVMFMSPVQLKELAFEAKSKQQIKSALQFLSERIEECTETGCLEISSVTTSEETALHLWSHCHGLVSLNFSGRFDEALEFENFYTNSCALLYQSIGLNFNKL